MHIQMCTARGTAGRRAGRTSGHTAGRTSGSAATYICRRASRDMLQEPRKIEMISGEGLPDLRWPKKRQYFLSVCLSAVFWSIAVHKKIIRPAIWAKTNQTGLAISAKKRPVGVQKLSMKMSNFFSPPRKLFKNWNMQNFQGKFVFIEKSSMFMPLATDFAYGARRRRSVGRWVQWPKDHLKTLTEIYRMQAIPWISELRNQPIVLTRFANFLILSLETHMRL
jgi:hypothetical protein